MSVLITLGNINPCTFANVILAADMKSQELFGNGLERVEVFHSLQSFDILRKLGNPNTKITKSKKTWINHLENNLVDPKIIIHRTIEKDSYQETVDGFSTVMEEIIVNSKRKGWEIIVDLTNGTGASRTLLSKAASDLDIKHRYIMDVRALFEGVTKPEYMEVGILQKCYVAAPEIFDVSQQQTGKILPNEDLRILLLASNPKAMNAQLNLQEEIRDIKEKIGRTDFQDKIDLIEELAVRSKDLLFVLNKHRPHIVQFCGHGNKEGEIYVSRIKDGEFHNVSPEALEELFKTLKDNIKVVLLNACYTLIPAEAIAKSIDFTIGMPDEFPDQAAVIFSAAFYQAIGFGRSIKDAFDQGQTALMLEGFKRDEKYYPKLITKKDIDPAEYYLFQPN